jgi:hypothetical protein
MFSILGQIPSGPQITVVALAVNILFVKVQTVFMNKVAGVANLGIISLSASITNSFIS